MFGHRRPIAASIQNQGRNFGRPILSLSERILGIQPCNYPSKVFQAKFGLLLCEIRALFDIFRIWPKTSLFNTNELKNRTGRIFCDFPMAVFICHGEYFCGADSHSAFEHSSTFRDIWCR